MGTNGFDCIQIPGAMNVMVDMDSQIFNHAVALFITYVMCYYFLLECALDCRASATMWTVSYLKSDLTELRNQK